MLNGLDLFSGIGGISLALSPWVRPIAYCEQSRYAQGVLLSRMSEGTLSTAPIWDDVTTLVPSMLSDAGVDIIYGGFPCQDISVAGNGKGLAGERSRLFYEIVRLTKEIRPAFVFLENVPAIRTRGLREVIRAFTDIGYDCRWACVSAAEVGAPHLRKRWFLLAHSNSQHLSQQCGRCTRSNRERSTFPNGDGDNRTMADPSGSGLSRQRAQSCGTDPKDSPACSSCWWSAEPAVGRVVNGLPNRVDRLKCLGNAVVPAQVQEAFKRLIGLE